MKYGAVRKFYPDVSQICNGNLSWHSLISVDDKFDEHVLAVFNKLLNVFLNKRQELSAPERLEKVLAMDIHFSKLPNSLIEICVVVGMDQDTGLVAARSAESKKAPKSSKQQSPLSQTLFETHVLAALSGEVASFCCTALEFDSEPYYSNLGILCSPTKGGNPGRRARRGSVMVKAAELPLAQDVINSLPQFCFPDGGYISMKKKPVECHSLVLTDIEGNRTYCSCMTFYRGFLIEEDKDVPGNYKLFYAEEKTDGQVVPGSSYQLFYVPTCCCLISKWPYFNIMKDCLSSLLPQVMKSDPALFRTALMQFVSQLAMVPVPPPGSLGISLFTFIQPFSWSWTYVPILPSALIDLVEAPGAFIMGCHKEHKSKILRVVEGMDELSSFVIADIDEGSVTSPPRIQRLPTYAAELYKFRQTFYSLQEWNNCRDKFIRDFQRLVLASNLEMMLRMFSDIKNFIVQQEDLFFDMDTYIESKPAENQDFFREVCKSQAFSMFLYDLIHNSEKADYFTLMAQKTRVVPKTGPLRKRSSSALTVPVIPEECFADAHEELSIFALPPFVRGGIHTGLFYEDYLRTLNYKITDPTNKSSGLLANHLYLRGMLRIARGEKTKAVDDFFGVSSTSAQLFPTSTVKEIMCKLSDLEVEELRTRHFWRKAERLRVNAKEKWNYRRARKEVVTSAIPSNPLAFKEFVKHVSMLQIANGEDAGRRLFQALANNSTTNVIDPDTFAAFYDALSQASMMAKSVSLRNIVLERNEFVLKISKHIKTNKGMGWLVLTVDRLLFLPDGTQHCISVVRNDEIKNVEPHSGGVLLGGDTAIRITSTESDPVSFIAFVKEEKDFWRSCLLEMKAGYNISDVYKDKEIVKQAAQNVIMADSLRQSDYPDQVAMANGYTKTFLRNCQKPVTNSNALDEREPATGFAVIPYIQGVTEPIKRILNSHNVKVAQKPFQTLGHIFAKPKDPVTKEQRTDAIYSIPCNDCDNEYIGQTKRQFGTRLKEHQKAQVLYFSTQGYHIDKLTEATEKALYKRVSPSPQDIEKPTVEALLYVRGSKGREPKVWCAMGSGVVVVIDTKEWEHETHMKHAKDRVLHVKLDQRNGKTLYSIAAVGDTFWCATRFNIFVINYKRDDNETKMLTPKEDGLMSVDTMCAVSNEEIWTGCDKKGLVVVWNTATYKNKHQIVCECNGFTCMLKVDYNTIWAGSKSGKIYVISVKELQVTMELSLHQDRVRSMCLTDEGLVISGPGSRDGRIAVWKSHLSEERPAIQRFSHERPRRPKQIRREVTVCDNEDGFELVCRK
ncbi:hypothetical protein pdam_00013948 [Pocillopora damicornis]|uniref:UDENN domain-containing protein n=1 Tax=Pocillopora damicornis TaxID=46731 RepID=A0A3M6U8M7_POCDA|nr:hypothetical protein pdam_00013948 [Pocillopora damicornis]